MFDLAEALGNCRIGHLSPKTEQQDSSTDACYANPLTKCWALAQDYDSKYSNKDHTQFVDWGYARGISNL
jgi:hypothetical protein